MPRRPWRIAGALAVLVVTLGLSAPRLGPLPPLGVFLNPATGVWSVAPGAELPEFTLVRRMRTLDSSVRVFYDTRGVPHIFAHTTLDAYRALGYVVARDRLFQLDIQTRAASGHLTELLGAAALPLDREARALGLPRAAERQVASWDTTGLAYRASRAYADGVNTWIARMKPQDLPFEYHLLGRRPVRWLPINTLHLLNRMSVVLAMSDDEAARTALAARVGTVAADALLPIHSPLQQPIVPPPAGSGITEPRWLPGRLPPPGAPDTTLPGFAFAPPPDAPHYDVGSNNWAVAPRRTRNGAALLAGDPHLDLTLPSIWYEAHLVVPGEMDVYGVTIPGSPNIVIGFNRDIAWTFTNTGADVMDEYAETVDDPVQPTRYRVDGAWRPIERDVEAYRDPSGRVLATDTLRYTHRGPLRRVGGHWISTRWTALEPSDNVTALDHAAHAHTVAEFLRGMEGFLVPAQNMLVADRAGTIAIRSNGRFPVRGGDDLGTVIRDGALAASDWRADEPVAAWPTAINPPQGFLASANQEPSDPAASPGYLAADWEPPWRAMRINALLRADSAVTPDAMRRFQTDPGSARADFFVPFFLRAARGSEAGRLLAEWDRRYTRENTRAVLFEEAMDQLQDHVWRRLPVRPNEAVLGELLGDSTSAWWDAPRDSVLAASLRAALTHVTRLYGPPDGGGWRWDRVRSVHIYHLLEIPALSRLGIPVDGGTETVSPLGKRGVHGPSWRMVVELGPTVRAWAIYPGGQSGNPVSPRYADRLPRWAAGVLDSIAVPRTPDEAASNGAIAILEFDRTR